MLLGCELADRLQHPQSRLAVRAQPPAEQALVDERLQGLDVGIADRLCGIDPAAIDEDRQSSEEPLFFRSQQLVRPLDRRSQRLLTWICVTTAFEQVEALAESIEQLFAA